MFVEVLSTHNIFQNDHACHDTCILNVRLVYIVKVLGSNPDQRLCFLRFIVCLPNFLQDSLERKLKVITFIFFHISDWPQIDASLISSYFYSVI
jgi:hypothetical protein